MSLRNTARVKFSPVVFLASVFITGALLFGVAIITSREPSVPQLALPPFALPGLRSSDPQVSLAGLLGTPAVVTVFDYNCAPCVEELPMLSRVSTEFPGVAVVGIHFMLRKADAVQFVNKLAISFPVVHDQDGVVGPSLVGLPSTYFLDKNGQEVDRIIGSISEDDLRNRIERLRQ
jgi:thiol-disulfide isomerase/thioredoxin